MNRRQFLFLLVALLVLGGAGLGLFWQDIAAYRAAGARIGAPLLPDFRVADVASLRLRDGKHQVTLARRDTAWVVEERGGYAANVEQIGGLLIKLAELKVTQSEQVAPTLLARLDLAEPDKGEGAGTLVELRDGAGKPLARLVLGRKVLKKDPVNPLPGARNGVPAGRYVLPPGAADRVVVVSDPLNAAEADPGRWLDKEFFRVERIRRLAVGPEGAPGWRVARSEEWGQWRFADGAGDLDASAAVSAVNALGSLSFRDVALWVEEAGQPVVAVAETFDRLTYTVRLAPRKGAEDYYLSYSVAGSPPKRRVPEKGEKKEERERRDKDFAENLKRLEERLAREQALSKWTFVVAKRDVEPLLRQRGEMVRRPEKAGRG